MTPERWQHVEKLYQAALEREPSQRAAFLERACAGDEELRHEVESLLANDASLSISPDGHRLAFGTTDASGNRLLWVRPLDSVSAQLLPRSNDGELPFWSPDSRFVVFFAEGKLKKIELSGGSPQTLCDVPSGGAGRGTVTE